MSKIVAIDEVPVTAKIDACIKSHQFTDADYDNLLRKLARAQEVFEAESECGICKSTQLGFPIIVDNHPVDEEELFKLTCCVCGATFDVGANQWRDVRDGL